MIVIKKERYIYYVSEINGNSFCSYLGNDTEEFRKKIEVAFHFKDPLLHENHDYRNKHICLNISNACNLKCSYCFRYKNESTKPIDFYRACKFIESQIDDNFDRFMVDMTGSGEPLLQLKTIIKLADFCTSLSKKIGKEIVPQIATNGTLLTKRISNLLKRHRILYGISIDGDSFQQDSSRQYINGQGTYKDVINNVKNIKNKDYLGAAVTINRNNFDLIKIIDSLIDYFPTISMKPVRSKNDITLENIDLLLTNYSKLNDYLMEKTARGDTRYIISLLSGDDYFGKFIRRAILNIKVNTRCDIGVARVSLSEDGNIYGCPAAVGINELIVGKENNGNIIYNSTVAYDDRIKCRQCFAKYSCGGSCVVDNYYSTKNINNHNEIMCSINKYLFLEAIRFNITIASSNKNIYQEIKNFCMGKEKRDL